MNFCSQCGSRRIDRIIPLGDIGLRHVCPDCGVIHYHNPNIVAGCIATWEGRVLLCQRAIEPFRGLWTVPAGYLEMGETIEESAARETLEEAHVRVADLQLFALYNLPTFGEVYALFESRLESPVIAPGHESLDVRLFAPADIPWQAMAFPMVKEALLAWCHEPEHSERRVNTADFFWGPEGAVRIRRHSQLHRSLR